MTQLLSWANNNSVLFLILALIGSYLTKELLLFQLKRLGKIVYFFLIPGVVLHELSHLFACIITFTRVKTFSLYEKGGGFVVYEKPKTFLVNFIISIAPLAIGIVVTYFLLRELSSSPYQVKNILFLYFGISVSLSMFPSGKDHQNALTSYLVIVPIIALILYLKPSVQILNDQTSRFLIYFIGALVAANLLIFTLKEVGFKKKW